MRYKVLCYSLALQTFVVLASAAHAQGHSTNSGRTYTQGSSTVSSGPAIQVGEDSKGGVPPVKRPKKKPVTLDFDSLPQSPWTVASGDGASQATVANGILTIDSYSFYEFLLWHPDDVWHQYVDNSRGWLIEARLRLDPISLPGYIDRGAVQIWANDNTNLLIIGFDPNEVRLSYPDVVRVPMNTTDALHTYRIESKLNRVKLFVDDILRIDHVLSWPGGGSDVLDFGDGQEGRSLSYWDYFSYDVSP